MNLRPASTICALMLAAAALGPQPPCEPSGKQHTHTSVPEDHETHNRPAQEEDSGHLLITAAADDTLVGAVITRIDGQPARGRWGDIIDAARARHDTPQSPPDSTATLEDGRTIKIRFGSRMYARQTWHESPDGPRETLTIRYEHHPNIDVVPAG